MVSEGKNVQRFLIGRQFLAVFVVFLIAQLTTFRDLDLNWPSWLHVLIIDTGFAGALFTLCFGQLIPQLVASTHPVLMLGVHGAYLVTRTCIMLEWIGVCQASWVLKRLFLADEHQERQIDRPVSNSAQRPKSCQRGSLCSSVVVEITDNSSSSAEMAAHLRVSRPALIPNLCVFAWSTTQCLFRCAGGFVTG